MLELPSFTFVPGWLYVPLFDWMILLLILTTVAKCNDGTVYKWNASKDTRFWGNIFVIFLILYIGLRPTTTFSEYPDFCDTFNYKADIIALKQSGIQSWLDTDPFSKGEWLYACIESISAAYANEHLAFLLCATAYVGCAALFCQRTFDNQWFIPFLMICAAFTFFAYGANGVRNGMAASMVILAFSYRDKLWLAALLCFLAIGVHKSMMLLIASSLLCWKITNPKLYIAGWLLCILAAAVAGGTLSTAIASSGIIEDERFASYGIRGASSNGYYTGFRADFILYSSLPIITGAFFIFKKRYQDTIYIWLYNIYITSNAFWVLMMYASFSNRFAQLSWFIMPIVCIYPWMKHSFWKTGQSKRLGNYILICYAYTFFSHFLLLLF